MAPHSSTLAWKIPWTEDTFPFMHWRRKWQPTPMFLPGESQGRGSLAGCRLWGRTESDKSILLEPAKKECSWLSGRCWHFTTEACWSARCRGNTHRCTLQPGEGSRVSRGPRTAGTHSALPLHTHSSSALPSIPVRLAFLSTLGKQGIG